MVTAKAIKRARAKVNETEAQFAKRLGVDQSTVNRWESSGPPERGLVQKFLANVLAEINSAQVAAE